MHVKDGKSAMDLALTNADIDMILMGLQMPVLDGLTATEYIKKLRPGLPIIAQTSYNSPLDRQNAMDAGCDDLITKPVDRNLLVELLNNYLELQ